MIFVAASLGVIVGMWIGWWTAKVQHTDDQARRWERARTALDRHGSLTIVDVVDIWGEGG